MSDARWLAKATKVVAVERGGAVYLLYGYGTDDEKVCIPGKYEVCDLCAGKGVHVNPNIDDEGISSKQFAEDPDFAESYWSGAYDVACYQCAGKRVMVTPDEDRCGAQELREYKKYMRALVEIYEEEQAERRMGA